jgi:hypothetical protein
MSGKRLATGLTLLAAAAALFALVGQSAGAKSKPGGTASGLRKARWASNVSVSFLGGKMRWRSNGIPNVGSATYYAVPSGPGGTAIPNASNSQLAPASQVIRAQNYDFSITTSPKKVRKKTQAPLGAIGVMISGGTLFNPYEADNSTVALAHNFTISDANGHSGSFIDGCTGHPNQNGQYHYHGLPTCLTSEVDRAKGPSHILGVAFDGFPIYGDRDIKGRRVKQGKLDACNGITSPTPEFPRGIYHYVLLDVPTSRSSLRCFHGKVSTQTMRSVSAQVAYCWVGQSAGEARSYR